MRTITQGDVSVAARAIRGLPPDVQRHAISLLLEAAHAADIFRKRFGRAHPLWGNGSLMAAAMVAGGGRQDPFASDLPHLEAMAAVIEAILDWRRR